MRRALRTNPARQQVAIERSIPAPVGGWDAQSPLAAMPAKNAVVLKNWIPRPGYVEVRKGFAPHQGGYTDEVESLVVWRGSSDKILACAGSKIINATTVSSAPGSTLFASATNARWQYTNFGNDAGQFAIMVNGADTPRRYDGSTLSTLTITGSSGAVTLTATNLIDVMPHKRRLHFIEKNSRRVWFLDVNAIQGAAGLLDLGPVFQKGGNLVALASWTLDGGQGPDDYAVYMTDQGEVAVYQGTDPSDATAWALVGVFSLGLPLGRRALLKYGSDLAVLTTDGVVPLSQAMTKDRTQDDDTALTAKIQGAFSNAALTYRELFGWQGLLYAKGSLAIFNVPTAELSKSKQFVQNVQTGSWCEFTGIHAFCWDVANGRPYFGGEDGVYEWDATSSDNGATILAEVQTAFSYFMPQGRTKKFNMVRPVLRVDQTVDPAVAMFVDFQSMGDYSTPETVTQRGGIWGVDLWGTAIWSGPKTRYEWTSVTGVGYAGSVGMRVSLNSDAELDVQLIGFDVLYQSGGQL